MNHPVGKQRIPLCALSAVWILCLVLPEPASAGIAPKTGRTGIRRDHSRGTVVARRRRSRSRRYRRRAKRKAKRFFKKAEEHFSQGRYSNALELYKAAYRAWPVAPLQFNIGQCYRKMGKYKLAIEHYEKFLARAKNPKRKSIVQRVLNQTRALLAAQQGAQRGQEQLKRIAAGLTKGQRKELAMQVKRLEAERRTLEAKRRRIEVELRAREDMLRRLLRLSIQAGAWKIPPGGLPFRRDDRKKAKPTPFYKKWWFWTTIAVGVAAAVGTGVGVAMIPREKAVYPSGSLGTFDRR